MTATNTNDRCPRTGVGLPECSCPRCFAVLLREHGLDPPPEFDRRKPPLVDRAPSVMFAGGPSND
jgi:hypothetical protein